MGNRHAVKECRQVEMGWLHYAKGDYHQVRTRHGGGTWHLTVQKTATMGELLEISKGLFFPEGCSAKGPVEDREQANEGYLVCYFCVIKTYCKNVIQRIKHSLYKHDVLNQG